MRGDRDDVATQRSGPRSRTVRRGSEAVPPGVRTAGLAVGGVLAVAATVVVFVTDDPQVLRLAVIGAAWAFVLAALVTARRGGAVADGGDVAAVEREAAEREAELRLAYELELEREVAARRELELRVENDVRRETEQAVRADLAALRGELAGVAELRRDVARVAELRSDVAGLSELRRDVARLAELRTGLDRLADLRGDLAQLADLRADVGRLRTELTEQLSGEMLVERIMLRTQSIRTAPATTEAPAAGTIDAGWADPALELTAARPGIRLEDLTGGGATRQFAEVRVETPAPQRPAPAASVAPPPLPPLDWLAERSLVEPTEAASARHSRHSAAEPRRRHTDDPHRPVAPGEQPTEQRPAVGRDPVPGADHGSSRLAEILAANGAGASGGRRRRRYRDDDEPDDVLDRVLGR
ncbi:DUF6779 domain-containing protein [Geodermatophilus sp. SYSU D00708]